MSESEEERVGGVSRACCVAEARAARRLAVRACILNGVHGSPVKLNPGLLADSQ